VVGVEVEGGVGVKKRAERVERNDNAASVSTCIDLEASTHELTPPIFKGHHLYLSSSSSSSPARLPDRLSGM